MIFDDIDEYIELLRASKAGKQLQFLSVGGWWDVSLEDISFTFPANQYRIKPRVPKEIWVNEYSNGYCATHPTEQVAQEAVVGRAIRVAVKYREVIE